VNAGSQVGRRSFLFVRYVWISLLGLP